MPPIIRVENLGKKYTIRHEHPERYVALRDILTRQAKKLFSFPKALRAKKSTVDNEEFWALKDIDFEVQPGDRVGIIGRNGAGKSTLLKILSRISEPTTGRVELNGRVASLLEVGTGFHPELTGRENIFLNGAILGMSRAEIRRKFDEIVDFSGVEQFLDTPVKRYSSGMYVRLAFAVAAHLEPEILIVDEVLAVGDAEFQKKCLGKMEEVSAKEGRTVLFVSHNMGVVKALCNSGLVLEKGRATSFSYIDQAAEYYTAPGLPIHTFSREPLKHKTVFSSISLKNNVIQCLGNLEIEATIHSPVVEHLGIELEIRNEEGIPVSYASSSPMQGKLLHIKIGQNTFVFHLKSLNLASGRYFLYLWLIKPWVTTYDQLPEPLSFEVNTCDPYSTGFDFKQSYRRGNVFHEMEIEKQD